MFEPGGVVLWKCDECESLQARPRAVKEGLLAPNCKSYWYGRDDELLAAKAPRPSLNATAPNRPERAEPDAGSERCLRSLRRAADAAIQDCDWGIDSMW